MQRELKNDEGEVIGTIKTNDPTAYCPDLESKPVIVDVDMTSDSDPIIPETTSSIEEIKV